MHTPQGQQITDIEEAPTPLQIATQEQSAIFDSKKFEKILGGVNWKKLLNKFKNGEQSFKDLSNQDISADDNNKRFNFSQLMSYFMKFNGVAVDEAEFFNLRNALINVRNTINEVPEIWTKDHTQKYFENIYKNNTSINFSEKKNGRQLGTIVEISFENQANHIYYIKTHADGWARKVDGGIGSLATKAPNIVNIQELLTYDILAKLKRGPQAYFFGRDEKNVFIATRDINQTGHFIQYSEFKENYDFGFNKEEILNPKYSIDLQEKITVTFDESTYTIKMATDTQADIFENDKAQAIMKKMTELDLIIRLLGLYDVYDNSGNFGFCKNELGLSLHILDFNINKLSKQAYGDFDTFIIGNGSFQAYASDNFIDYVFKFRNPKLRLKDALEVLNSDLFKNIEGVLNDSVENIQASFSDCNITNNKSIDQFNSNMDLYMSSLKHNIKKFKSSLEQFIKENPDL